MKIISIVGARPQFIKAAVISRAIRDYNARNSSKIEEVIVHTGQHFDENMSQVFFDEMDIPKPSYNLEIASLSHGAMTGRMIEKLEGVLILEKPDWVVLYGDTNSTLAAAVAAKKLHLKIAHVEAGLRSFNIEMPEEQNRILADRISDILLCPTEKAMENLKKEGVSDSPYGQKSYFTGDVMYDAVLYYCDKAERKSNILSSLNLEADNFVLSTIHRAETTNDTKSLEEVINAISEISKTTKVVLPLHPRTKKIMEEKGINADQLMIIDPVSYFDMLALEKNAKCIITDSGGVQKEAYFMKKPCITVRTETEWVELIEEGVNFLAGLSQDNILRCYENTKDLQDSNFQKEFYGNGKAGEKIVNIIANEPAGRTGGSQGHSS